MANTNLVGDDGKLTIDASTVLGLTSWSIDLVADTADGTTMNNGGWKTHLPSMKSWTGSCEALLTIDNANGTDKTSANLAVGSTGDLVVFCDADIGAGTYSGDVIITGYSVSSSIGDTIKVSVSFQGTGTLLVTSASAT